MRLIVPGILLIAAVWSLGGCAQSADGGDPTKAPKVEVVDKPAGMLTPEQEKAANDAKKSEQPGDEGR